MNEQLLQYVICVILDIVPFIELHTLYVEDDTFFGVFVTITRSDNDIHGCQGFYDHDLQNQSSSVLLKSMQRVAHSAVRDERAHSLPLLYTDGFASVTVSFMYRPETLTNEFDPKTDGILVKHRSQTATYLPDVFDSRTSLRSIKQSLLKKAGIRGSSSSRDSRVFYKYSTRCYTSRLNALLFSNTTYVSTLFTNIGSFFDRYYTTTDTPLHIHGNRVSTDTNDTVRTVSIDVDLYKYSVTNTRVRRLLEHKIQQYYDRFKTYDKQALSFLLYQTHTKRPFVCEYVNSITSSMNTEHVFAYPEILLSLCKNCETCKKTETLLLVTEFFEQRPNDIFNLNWIIQLFVTCFVNDYDNVYYTDLVNAYVRLGETMTRKSETNELAVMFECGCYLLRTVVRKTPVHNVVFKLFVLLQHRYSVRYGVYMFKDTTARLDITFHVLNGFRQLKAS